MSPLPSSRPHRAHVPAALSLVAASLLGGALAAQPTGASAAARGVDPRWQAFAGCWSPATDAAAGEPLPAGAPARCIVPAGGNAADLVSIAEGRVVARERVDAGGAPVTRADAGCTGTTTARWSADGRRLYTRSQATCGDAAGRRGSGILALGDGWQLLDARGMAAAVPGVPLGVRVTRWRAADGLPAALPAADRAVLEAAGTPGSDDARLLASAPIGLGIVPEVVTAVDHEVAEAWLAARGQGFTPLDGRRLQLLAAQGVRSSTLDLLIALSYPRTFAVNPRTGVPGERAPQVAGRTDDVRRPGPFAYLDPYWGWNGLWGSGFANGPAFGYGRGYGNGWGNGWGNGVGGWGWNSWGAPVVIVQRPSDAGGTPAARRTARPRSASEGGSTGGSAIGSDGGSRSVGSSGGSSGSSGSAGSSGSSGSSGNSGGGSSSGGSGGGRTARPRP